MRLLNYSRRKALLLLLPWIALALAMGGCARPVPSLSPPSASTATLTSSLPLAHPPTPTPTPANSPRIELVILHTNDTWGYILPCG